MDAETVKCRCGRKARVIKNRKYESLQNPLRHRAQCSNPEVLCWIGPYCDTKEEALEEWNKLMEVE